MIANYEIIKELFFGFLTLYKSNYMIFWWKVLMK